MKNEIRCIKLLVRQFAGTISSAVDLGWVMITPKGKQDYEVLKGSLKALKRQIFVMAG